jgi:hypothetical protein
MRTLSKRKVIYLIEYLGEFKFIFETILDYESGDQMGSFDAKNRHRKSHSWAPLRTYNPDVFSKDWRNLNNFFLQTVLWSVCL